MRWEEIKKGHSIGRPFLITHTDIFTYKHQRLNDKTSNHKTVFTPRTNLPYFYAALW
jgi:hypothetical protein